MFHPWEGSAWSNLTFGTFQQLPQSIGVVIGRVTGDFFGWSEFFGWWFTPPPNSNHVKYTSLNLGSMGWEFGLGLVLATSILVLFGF